ncbi:MAG: T9SS type A sorting domain-containing protein [Cytophagales bacterium]|nr:T9SS type A sorting domain-containing protein [Cytophagales bacterium]
MNYKICLTLFSLLFFNLSLCLFAQDSIPNGSFENWSIIDSNEVPDNWQFLSGKIVKDSAGYQSNYAIKLEVYNPGFENNSGLATTGFPLNSIPSNLKGFVKCNVMPNDTVYIEFLCYSGNSLVANGKWISTSSITTYAPFSISIDSSGITGVDSAVIMLTSGCCGSFGGASIGTELVVDELELGFYTGINEKSEREKNKLLIYPNPTTGTFTLSVRTRQSAVNNKLQIYIYDILGELVYLTEITDVNSEIKIPKMSKGIYFVKVNNEHNQYVKKIIYQ